MAKGISFPRSSIARKQMVAITGLGLLVFIIGHLLGNLYIYNGSEGYNAYAATLAKLRPFLYFIEGGLAFFAVVHIFYAISLVLQNLQARGTRYAVYHSRGERTWGSRLMPYTGILILIFVIGHLIDFTFADKSARGVIAGVPEEIYGVVYNAFSNPLHGIAYILALFILGLHLSHAIQGAFQTFGLNGRRYHWYLRKFSYLAGYGIAFLYITIPLSILTKILEP